MAGTKEIRTRIKSVQQTLKITNAMYLISSANLRKAKGQLDRAAPTSPKSTPPLRTFSTGPRSWSTSFRPADRCAGAGAEGGLYRGQRRQRLAGAYNHNVLRRAEEYAPVGPPQPLCGGGRGPGLFSGPGHPPSWRSSPMWCRTPPCGGPGRSGTRWSGGFWTGAWTRCTFCTPRWSLPEAGAAGAHPAAPGPGQLPLGASGGAERAPGGDLCSIAGGGAGQYHPQRLYPGMVFGALVESFSSEQSARMTAMEAASDNAKEMLRSPVSDL